MKWSLKLGKIFGIDFQIHITFFLLLLFVFISGLLDQKVGIGQAFLAVLFICAVFVCVLIHEIGHSLIARRFGKETKSIILLPIGGMAVLEQVPDKPLQEIAMAIIGPFINLFIAGLLYIAIGRWSGIGQPSLQPDSAPSFFADLIFANIMLAVFNLIPAFPMDGGRVLRGILALKMDMVRATKTAVFIGQAIAIIFIVSGLYYNIWLAIIGFFLYIGAGSERQEVIVRSLLHQDPVSKAMTTDFLALQPQVSIADALERFYHGCQDDFPVVGQFGLEGILTRDRILASLHGKSLDVPISDIMERDYVVFDVNTPLNEVYSKLLSSRRTAGVVIENGRLLGMVSLDGISKYLMVKTARNRKK